MTDLEMKLVLFDLDGVIVSTDTLHYRAWQAMADRHGLRFNYDINHRLRGVSRAESLRIILSENATTVPDDEFDAMASEKNATYRELLEDLTPQDVLPGSVDLLDDLGQAGVLIGIGSSSKNTPLILERIELAEAFDVIVDGNDITKSKPDPQVFAKGADALGVDPSECVVFEDAQSGIEAALRAGMVAVGVGDQALEGAHHMIENLSQTDHEQLLSIHRSAPGSPSGE